MTGATAVWGGLHREVGPSRLRSHLGYLVTTVVSLHIVGFCMLIAKPAPHLPAASPRAMHLRMLSQATQGGAVMAGAAAGDAHGSGGSGAQELTAEGGAAALARPGDSEPATEPVASAAALAAGAAQTQRDIPAAPEAATILAQQAAAPVADDDAMLADLQAQAEQLRQSSSSWASDGANEYLPRSALTQAPQTRAPVIIDFPLRAGQLGHFATVLALFIDESGVVRRIRVDGAALPEAFEEAARNSFMRAQFRPGQLNGQVVKSLIRVEVVFDNTSIDVDRGVKSLSFSL